MEAGIFNPNLLFLNKFNIPSEFGDKNLEPIILYKHYILCFNKDDEAADCIVIDTQKKAVTSTSTGLNLEARAGYSICHWKDNLFVLFGGVLLPKDIVHRGRVRDSISKKEAEKALDVHLLEVNEENSKISFKIRSFNDGGKNTSHTAHIYKDNLHVLGGEEANYPRAFEVWRFDLNANQWSKCETKGETPRPRLGFSSALFNNKIYVMGGNIPAVGGFFAYQAARDLFVLDLDDMGWTKIYGDDFLALPTSGSSTAEVVGQKIYIQHAEMMQLTILDLTNNTLQYAKGFPPRDGWMIRSFQNRSMLFRHSGRNRGAPYVEFQEFFAPTMSNQTSSEIQVESPGTQFVQTKKNLLSQSNHMNLLWEEKPFADVTFVVGSEEIQAHRIILLKCHYFQNMFNSGMMEASSNKINVPDISPTNFKAILEYIYFGKIALTETLALDLIILVDMYCMAELKADCETYLSTNLKTNNLLKIIKAAETADSQKLEDEIVGFLIENIGRLQQEVDLHEIPHELLVKSIIKMKQKTPVSQKPTTSFFHK